MQLGERGLGPVEESSHAASEDPSVSVVLRDRVREALKSGVIPSDVEQDNGLLQQFSEALLKKLRGFGSDLHGSDGLNAINSARQACNATTVPCRNVAVLLRERFVNRCETHCSCKMELRMYPLWIISLNSVEKITELRSLQEEIKRERSLCNSSRGCVEDQDLRYEMLASESRRIPEQLPELRRRLQEYTRIWESCPFENSFENCSDAKMHMVSTRMKLIVSYNTTIELIQALDCRIAKYVNCSGVVQAELAVLREEQAHNERMLRQVSFLILDPTLARLNIAVYAILLSLSIALLGIGFYWDVLGLFKKYTAVLIGISVVNVLGIVGFSIGGLLGVPKVSMYQFLMRVRAGFMSCVSC